MNPRQSNERMYRCGEVGDMTTVHHYPVPVGKPSYPLYSSFASNFSFSMFLGTLPARPLMSGLLPAVRLK